MRVIGTIQAQFDGDTVTNPDYVNGFIVELTKYEANILKGLQDACDGQNWDIDSLLRDHPYYRNLKDIDMAEAFGLVLRFMETRFAVNGFKEMIKGLEATLNGLEKNEL